MTSLYIRVLAVLFIAVAASESMSRIQRDSLLTLLPAAGALKEWSAMDSAHVYRGKDLFVLIDGGAELFLEYGFLQVVTVEYQHRSTASITLEIYEMLDPGAAYGIYSIRSGMEGTRVQFGQEGIAHPYYIMFWKERYYVSIAGSDTSGICRAGLEAIARSVDKNIARFGERPEVVEFLPHGNLLKERYLRGFLGLASVQVIDVKEMFPFIDGAVGTYHENTAMLLRYGSAGDAHGRLMKINQVLASDERFHRYRSQDDIAQFADRTKQNFCVMQSGPYLIVTVSPDEGVALGSCKSLASAVQPQ